MTNFNSRSKAGIWAPKGALPETSFIGVFFLNGERSLSQAEVINDLYGIIKFIEEYTQEPDPSRKGYAAKEPIGIILCLDQPYSRDELLDIAETFQLLDVRNFKTLPELLRLLDEYRTAQSTLKSYEVEVALESISPIRLMGLNWNTIETVTVSGSSEEDLISNIRAKLYELDLKGRYPQYSQDGNGSIIAYALP